jgi:hypothetical protein
MQRSEREKEEGAVASVIDFGQNDRPANTAAKIVLVGRGPDIGIRRGRIEIAIGEVFIQAAAKLIAGSAW